MLKADMLFWRKFLLILQEWVFEIDPYYLYVENKWSTINNLPWYGILMIFKISYVDHRAVGNLIDQLSGGYGKEADLTVHKRTMKNCL